MNQATAPAPTVEAKFHVEPHPDPVVRALIEEVERLRRERSAIEGQLIALRARLNM